jgi:hypothetical protein
MRPPYPLARKPWTVLDQNCARDPKIVRPLLEAFDNGGPGIVLPWIVWREYTKSDKPLDTTIASLRELSARPEAVCMAIPMQVVRGREQDYGCVVEYIEDVRFTRTLRALLHALRTGGAMLDAYEAKLPEHKAWAEDMSGLTDYDAALRGLVAGARETVSRTDANELRAALENDNRAPLRAYLAQHCGREWIVRQLTSKELGYTGRKAERLTRQPSMAPLTILAAVQAGLLWHLWKGIEQQTADDLEREGNDIEYALLAVRCHGFVTKDTEARERYEDLLEVATRIWGWPDGPEATSTLPGSVRRSCS